MVVNCQMQRRNTGDGEQGERYHPEQMHGGKREQETSQYQVEHMGKVQQQQMQSEFCLHIGLRLQGILLIEIEPFSLSGDTCGANHTDIGEEQQYEVGNLREISRLYER